MTATQPQRPSYDIFRQDRPGWIPEWVGDDWDPDPYAYQTREELMPAGRFHSLYMQILAEMLRPVLERLALELVIDVFIFYRDWEERKQRVAPDALIAEPVELTPRQALRSYDLDVEPLPRCAIEITSASSQKRDLERKRLFYASLGIREYLVLDIVNEDDEDHLPEQIAIYLWRCEAGMPQPVAPDAEGFLLLECAGVRLKVEGQRLVAQVAASGEPLRTSIELSHALAEAERQRAEAERQAAAERQRADELAARLAALEAELQRLRQP